MKPKDEYERRLNQAKDATAVSNFEFLCLKCNYSGLWVWKNSALKCPACDAPMTEWNNYIGGWKINGERVIKRAVKKGETDKWTWVVVAGAILFIIGLVVGWLK